MNKRYIKPNMEVCAMRARLQLLAGSPETDQGVDALSKRQYDDWLWQEEIEEANNSARRASLWDE